MMIASAADAASRERGVAWVDPGKGMDFYGFISKADARDIGKFLGRLGEITLSNELASLASSVDKPITVVVLGYTYCPDMLIVAPFIESIRTVNPDMVTIRFYIRSDDYAEFLKKQTGIDRTPAIFLAKQDGRLLEGRFYSKFPQAVQNLIDSSGSSEESDSHIEDHRAGLYDGDVQGDLAEFLRLGIPELRRLR
jgi:hypothetical protein